MTTERIAQDDVQEYESVQQGEESDGLVMNFRPLRRSQRQRRLTNAVAAAAAAGGLGLFVWLLWNGNSSKESIARPFYTQSYTVKHTSSEGTLWNPFDQPVLPYFAAASHQRQGNEAYWTQPHIVNGSLVAIAEGDLYWKQTLQSMPMRITKTTGNIRNPRLHPHRPLVAYTATYTGRREVYLIDLSSTATLSIASNPLTCWEGEYGVKGIVGWKDDCTLLLSAYNRQVGLEDVRLYELRIDNFVVNPVPLAQATEGVYHDKEQCLYFTRFAQSSKTVRYVGGTAESLWKWCQGERRSAPLYPQYNGTTKAPAIYNDTLFFLSDRNQDGVASSMNLWAAPMDQLDQLKQLTNIYCQFDGLSLQEYSIDTVTGELVLRIGASLYHLSPKRVESALQSKEFPRPQPLSMSIVSDFGNLHERMIPIDLTKHLTGIDVMETLTGDVYAALTVRGQAVAAPVIPRKRKVSYQGAGQNMPLRRYRIAPSSQNAGSIRVLRTLSIPNSDGDCILLVAGDGPFADHVFYRVKCTPSSVNQFSSLPTPFFNESLGSVWDVVISPCGRRMAWSNTDTELFVMTLDETNDVTKIPLNNELGEPINAVESEFSFSPGGRYLTINHKARNQYLIISIADLGDPADGPVAVGRIAQVTPSRFNSYDAYWGKTSHDRVIETQADILAELGLANERDLTSKKSSTTLYFLSDRDLTSDVESPFGSRAPLPHYIGLVNVYALPLYDREETTLDMYSGGGVNEVFEKRIIDTNEKLRAVNSNGDTVPSAERRLSLKYAVSHAQTRRRLGEASLDSPSASPTSDVIPLCSKDGFSFTDDIQINFGSIDLSFARRAYRLAGIPSGRYQGILSQTQESGALNIIEEDDQTLVLKVFVFESYPSDYVDSVSWSKNFLVSGLSTNMKYIYFLLSDGSLKVCPNSVSDVVALLTDSDLEENMVDVDALTVSVIPSLDYRHMYNDAWRMLRDYFYDRALHGVDWVDIHRRYSGLVELCRKREDLDDVLGQMASELSALHVFVYGGDYNLPFAGEPHLLATYEPGSLGADLVRVPEWKGYRITEIASRDPDFNLIENEPTYSPLSNQTLALTGQRGLKEGDIIIGIDGESVLTVPDINIMLRGKTGRAVRLEVLRSPVSDSATSESLLIVPISQSAASDLRYNAWKWKTHQLAKDLARARGFSVGYLHMTGMDREGQDAFARDYFPDYTADALIIDVRHNHGGNTDSWIISFLQRKAWNFWSSRSGRTQDGDIDYNEHYAFRGHVVVLIDEKTSSDAEALCRGMSELGLGRIIGKRTWGGGIWLSSDNHLVDGGIATAPELGTYDQRFGWGSGIEQMGVSPDIDVDKDPADFYFGHDLQLERAIEELGKWLRDEPIAYPSPPGPKPDMSGPVQTCFV